MSVLIVGGCGFIGLNLAEAYLKAGQMAVLYDRNPLNPVAARTFEGFSGQCVVVNGDVGNAALLERTMRQHGVSRVFYGAAQTSGPSRERNDPGAVFAVNVVGLLNTLKAAAAAGARRAINIGSGSAYGATRSFGDTKELLREDVSPSAPETLYALSKHTAEQAARRFRALSGLDIVNVRLAGIYGPWEIDSGVRDTLSPFQQAARLALERGAAILPRRDSQDWTYSRHVAQALAGLMEAGTLAHDLYHVVAPQAVSVADWCARLETAHPGFSFRIADEGDTANVNLHSGRDRVPLSGERLRQDIGYAPPADPEVAFSDFLHWMASSADFWRY